MQFMSSGSLEDVQAYVSSVVAQRGGQIIAAGAAVTSAQFTKKFSWFWFIVLLLLAGTGLIYLLWWYISKDQSLAITYRVADGLVYGTVNAKGKRARKAAKQIVNAFKA